MYKCEICEKSLSNKGGLVTHQKTCEKIFHFKDEIRKLYVDDLWSIRDLCKKYNVGKVIITDILGNCIRDYSESGKIGRKRYPYTHTEESKKKLREKRLEYMRNNPEKTSWRQKNMSYPEKIFLDEVLKLGWGKKYTIIREYSVFPFFIDFAFVNEMVAVEIDGSQHLLEERKIRDNQKDELLIKKGWTIVRIAESDVKKNKTDLFENLEKILLSLFREKKYEFGLLEHPKTYEKKSRLVNGLTEGELGRMKGGRKTERPPLDELIKLVNEIGYVGTGKKFGVSDNAIRKWIKFYTKYEN
jgi:very-short-patch-repair endonuclease